MQSVDLYLKFPVFFEITYVMVVIVYGLRLNTICPFRSIYSKIS